MLFIITFRHFYHTYSYIVNLEIYTDANLLDLYREASGAEAVPAKPAPSVAPLVYNSSPDENGLNASSDADNSSENSLSDLIESNTAANHAPADDGAGEQEVVRRLETEPFWRVVSLLRIRQYSTVVELTSQAIATGTMPYMPKGFLSDLRIY